MSDAGKRLKPHVCADRRERLDGFSRRAGRHAAVGFTVQRDDRRHHRALRRTQILGSQPPIGTASRTSAACRTAIANDRAPPCEKPTTIGLPRGGFEAVYAVMARARRSVDAAMSLACSEPFPPNGNQLHPFLPCLENARGQAMRARALKSSKRRQNRSGASPRP